MEKDPFSKDSGSSYAFGDSRYLDTIPGGSVLIWDAHFGPHESKIPLDSLLVDPRQKVIAYFRPDEPWLTLGGGFYDCYITLAINDNVSADNYAIRDSILTADNGGAWRTIYCNSFENPGEADPVRLSTDTVHRGKKAYRMDSHTEFSPGFYRAVSSLELTGNDPEITANVYVNLPEIKPELNSLLVISFENNGEPYQYNSFNLNDRSLKPGTWNRITLSAKIPAFISTRDVVKVYIWNPGQQRFYFDDLSVVLKSGSK
jgi:hypothetical protein